MLKLNTWDYKREGGGTKSLVHNSLQRQEAKPFGLIPDLSKKKKKNHLPTLFSTKNKAVLGIRILAYGDPFCFACPVFQDLWWRDSETRCSLQAANGWWQLPGASRDLLFSLQTSLPASVQERWLPQRVASLRLVRGRYASRMKECIGEKRSRPHTHRKETKELSQQRGMAFCNVIGLYGRMHNN